MFLHQDDNTFREFGAKVTNCPETQAVEFFLLSKLVRSDLHEALRKVEMPDTTD